MVSDIEINNSDYKIPINLENFFKIQNNIVKIKDHRIKSNFKNNNLIINGSGKIKLNEKFDDVQYNISLKDKDFNLNSKLILSELKFNSQEYLILI